MALRYLLDKAFATRHPIDDWYHKKILNSIPRDVRTALAAFDLEPPLVSYVCCPRCCALYPQGSLDEDGQYPERCENKETSESDVCGAPLRTTRFIGGKAYSKPVRTYLYQDFPTWFGRLICRPGFEALMDKPLTSVHTPQRSVFDDIWDSGVVRDFLGPDGSRFFEYKGPEGRFLFSLAYDHFNPYHNKQAGKKVSVGALFMVCLNLPPMIRHKFENMYLVGIVPGPKPPSLTQSNHFIRPLVTHLDVFWTRGLYFNSTPEHPGGRVAKGAVIPLICDLHAARQMGAFGSVGSKFFCTFCGLLLQEIEDVNPEHWSPIRTCAEHRQQADSWLHASTPEERTKLFEEFGVRWTEFLRLPYWNPSLFTVFDSMHGWHLNAIENHVRTIWGVDTVKSSGDGMFVSDRPKGRKPTPKEILSALTAIQKRKLSSLETIRKPVLYQLCEAHEQRRAGTCHQMSQTLLAFYVCGISKPTLTIVHGINPLSEYSPHIAANRTRCCQERATDEGRTL